MKVLDPNWTPKQPSVNVIKDLYGTDPFADIIKGSPEEEHRTLELIRSLNELPDKQ